MGVDSTGTAMPFTEDVLGEPCPYDGEIATH
jgi:hypothetical protein